MNKNAITRVAAVAAAVVAMAPSSSQAIIPEVSDVTMTQAANRRVTVTYRLSNVPAIVTLDIQTNANTSAAADDPGWTSIGGRNICNAQGDVWKKVSGKDTYTITWQPDRVWTDAEGEGFKMLHQAVFHDKLDVVEGEMRRAFIAVFGFTSAAIDVAFAVSLASDH